MNSVEQEAGPPLEWDLDIEILIEIPIILNGARGRMRGAGPVAELGDAPKGFLCGQQKNRARGHESRAGARGWPGAPPKPPQKRPKNSRARAGGRAAGPGAGILGKKLVPMNSWVSSCGWRGGPQREIISNSFL